MRFAGRAGPAIIPNAIDPIEPFRTPRDLLLGAHHHGGGSGSRFPGRGRIHHHGWSATRRSPPGGPARRGPTQPGPPRAADPRAGDRDPGRSAGARDLRLGRPRPFEIYRPTSSAVAPTAPSSRGSATASTLTRWSKRVRGTTGARAGSASSTSGCCRATRSSSLQRSSIAACRPRWRVIALAGPAGPRSSGSNPTGRTCPPRGPRCSR